MSGKQRLTPKREAFAQLVVTLGNASEAYRQVYATARMKPETVRTEASRLMAAPAVAERIEELKSETRNRNELTRDEVIEKFRRAYDMAEEDRAHGALSQAASGLARIGGFNRESIQVDGARSSVMEPPEVLKELRKREAAVLTIERVRAAIMTDPSIAPMLQNLETAERRSREAKSDGRPDFEAVMAVVHAKSDLISAVEAADPKEGDDPDHGGNMGEQPSH